MSNREAVCSALLSTPVWLWNGKVDAAHCPPLFTHQSKSETDASCVCVSTSAASCRQANSTYTLLWKFYMQCNTLGPLWWILAAAFGLSELPGRTLNASFHVLQELVFIEGNKTPAAGVLLLLLLPTGCPAAAAVRLSAGSCWRVKPAHLYNL